MPNPKRQHSVSRQRKRRTHYKIDFGTLGPCPSCKKPILSHRICPFCGQYKGKPVVLVGAPTEKK